MGFALHYLCSSLLTRLLEEVVLGQIRGMNWVTEWNTVDQNLQVFPGVSRCFWKALGSGGQT